MYNVMQSAKPRHKSENKIFQDRPEDVRNQFSQNIVFCQIENKSKLA